MERSARLQPGVSMTSSVCGTEEGCMSYYGTLFNERESRNNVNDSLDQDNSLLRGQEEITGERWGEIDETEMIVRLLGAAVCGLLVITTLIGNTLVLIVVTKFRRLRSVTNLLLASLATADITVALLVMPFLVLYDVERRWRFGPIACHLWISCDVMCCTASILHLCVIALDRFWAITRPLRYRSVVSKRRVFMVIVIVWLCSAAISFIPIFMGWYSDGSVTLFEESDECSLNVNRIYAVVSSMTSFYLPLPVMFYVYYRILLVAEHQAREIKQLERSLQGASQGIRRSIRKRSRQIVTDTKAIRTLGIVMGVFTFCWLPFFLMYVIMAYCTECYLAYEVRSALTWLGYFNSSFNPCIYAFLNKDFKEAFHRVLCCRRYTDHDSPGMEDASTVSRSLPRMDRLNVDLITPEPRTPSITPDSSLWPTPFNYQLSPIRAPPACFDLKQLCDEEFL